MTSSRVALLALGGTIAMAGSQGGVVARLGGQDLVGALGAYLGDGITVAVHDIQAVPSAGLSFADVLEVVDAATAAVSDGAIGVVVTQGTDTLEETAFLVDLAWSSDLPIVLTGAMRNPTLPGHDGPANLVAAFQVAAAAGSAGRGALVVFNDEIHAARHVRKTHSTSPATFASSDLGPVGHLVEGRPRFLATVPRSRPVAAVDRHRLADTRVALCTAVLDDELGVLARVAEGQHGLVVAGFGVGHVPSRLAEPLGDLAAAMPVVLTSRTGAGSVLSDMYGAGGSERDLRERGLLNGGFLHPYKARVLLRVLIAGGADRDQIAHAFADYS